MQGRNGFESDLVILLFWSMEGNGKQYTKYEEGKVGGVVVLC